MLMRVLDPGRGLIEVTRTRGYIEDEAANSNAAEPTNRRGRGAMSYSNGVTSYKY